MITERSQMKNLRPLVCLEFYLQSGRTGTSKRSHDGNRGS